MRDMLPKIPWKRESGIINLDTHKNPGTHWVAYKKINDRVMYFDSFGNLMPPLEVINYLGDNIEYNYNQFQKYNTYNCGHLCIEFLLNKTDII